MTIMYPIQGDGFVLRKFVPSDAHALADIEFDPEVKRFLALPENPKAKWIENIKRLGIRGQIIQAANGRIAGRCALERAKRKGDAELIVVIGKTFWGQSLGSKVATLLVKLAFENLNAKALVAFVHPENKKGLRLVRALGFRRRGILAEGSWQAGHCIYRLPRNVYNQQLDRTCQKQRAG